MKKGTLFALVFLLILGIAYGDDGDKVLLQLYLKEGTTLSSQPVYENHPSEYDAAVAAAKRIRQDVDMTVTLLRHEGLPDEILNMYKLGRMGKPIAIRQFDNHPDGVLTRLYAIYVPFFYGRTMIGWVSITGDRAGKFITGAMQAQIAKDRRRYLMDEKDVTGLLERITGQVFDRVPFAVSFPYPHFGLTEEDFFWYTYSEQGIEKDGKVYHSFFVHPLVTVPDAEKVTFEDMMAPPFKTVITSRVYVLEEDMNLYEVDRKEKAGEISFDEGAFRRSLKYKKEYGVYDREVPPFALKLIPFVP
jgi:hypothetical protein